MKIIHIIDSLQTGGAERVTINTANIFALHNHEVTVLRITPRGTLHKQLDPAVKLIDLNRKWKYNPMKLIRLFNILIRYDIIHVHLHYNLRYVLLTGIFLFHRNIIYHEHAGDIRLADNYSGMVKKLIRLTRIITVSEHIKKWLIENFQLRARTITTIPNIIRNNQLLVSPHSASKQLVMIANFRAAKNIEFAVDVMKELGPEWQLTVYGSIIDQSYADSIKSHMKQQQVDWIKFITDCDDVSGELHAYSFGLHTALSESGPLSLIEVMAADLPFVAFDTGEVANQVKSGFPEFIMSAFEPKQWAERIRFIAENQDYQGKVRLFFEKTYSEEKYYQKVLSVYIKG